MQSVIYYLVIFYFGSFIFNLYEIRYRGLRLHIIPVLSNNIKDSKYWDESQWFYIQIEYYNLSYVYSLDPALRYFKISEQILNNVVVINIRILNTMFVHRLRQVCDVRQCHRCLVTRVRRSNGWGCKFPDGEPTRHSLYHIGY